MKGWVLILPREPCEDAAQAWRDCLAQLAEDDDDSE